MTKVIAFTSVLVLAMTCRASAQECNSLKNVPSNELVSYLNATVPDQKNAECITWAITELGNQGHEPGIATLVKFLDFKRPLVGREKLGLSLHPQGISEIYPAAGALCLIGKKALPKVLRAIEMDSTSATARENAVFVWMETFRYSDEHPKGVALLKQEEKKADNDAVKSRLSWAVQKALVWCNPPEEVARKAAAQTGTP
jgi:hypothetical protein